MTRVAQGGENLMINLWPQFCRSIIVFRLNHLHRRKFSLTLKVRPSLTLSSLGPVTPLACVVYLNVFLTHLFRPIDGFSFIQKRRGRKMIFLKNVQKIETKINEI